MTAVDTPRLSLHGMPLRHMALPEGYTAPRIVGGRVRTCRLVEIGVAYVPPAPAVTGHAEVVQRALLARPTLAERMGAAVRAASPFDTAATVAVCLSLVTGLAAVLLDVFVWHP